MRCKKCCGTEINAHLESLSVHRIVAEDDKKIVIDINPKHIENDEPTFWCAACGDMIEGEDIDEMDIEFEEESL